MGRKKWRHLIRFKGCYFGDKSLIINIRSRIMSTKHGNLIAFPYAF